MTDKFKDYLYGQHFEVYTDNNPLTYVTTSAKLDATGHRWVAELANYSFKLIYRSGKNNADADGLSRIPRKESCIYTDEVKAICQSAVLKGLSVSESLVVCSSTVLPGSDQEPDLLSDLKQVDIVKEQREDMCISLV